MLVWRVRRPIHEIHSDSEWICITQSSEIVEHDYVNIGESPTRLIHGQLTRKQRQISTIKQLGVDRSKCHRTNPPPKGLQIHFVI